MRFLFSIGRMGKHPTPRTLNDPLALRAIAHPTRNRILEELEAQGELRAVDVARELRIPANQANYHLRPLAKYGLVEDAGSERDKRDRVWRLTGAPGLRIQPRRAAGAPGGPAAVRAWRSSAAERTHELVERAHPLEDEQQRTVADLRVRLTADEAQLLADELLEVGRRWSARMKGRAGENGQTYSDLAMVQPMGPAHPAQGSR